MPGVLQIKMELVERSNGRRGGESSGLCTLPVVTKGTRTEVITGWAKLSQCVSPVPVLEPGRAGGAGWEPGGISAEPWGIEAMHSSGAEQRNTLSKAQVPGSSSSSRILAWQEAGNSRRRWRQIPSQPPIPSTERGLRQRLGGALLKAFTELAHFHPTSILETGTPPALRP